MHDETQPLSVSNIILQLSTALTQLSISVVLQSSAATAVSARRLPKSTCGNRDPPESSPRTSGLDSCPLVFLRPQPLPRHRHRSNLLRPSSRGPRTALRRIVIRMWTWPMPPLLSQLHQPRAKILSQLRQPLVVNVSNPPRMTAVRALRAARIAARMRRMSSAQRLPPRPRPRQIRLRSPLRSPSRRPRQPSRLALLPRLQARRKSPRARRRQLSRLRRLRNSQRLPSHSL